MAKQTIIDWLDAAEQQPEDTQEILFVLVGSEKIRSGIFSKSWQRVWITPGNDYRFNTVSIWAPMPTLKVNG